MCVLTAMFAGEEPMEVEGEDNEITQEDAWAVISSYFEEKGLVRQQLDSFNEFIQDTMQSIVEESSKVEVRPQDQHMPGRRGEFAGGADVRAGYNFRILVSQQISYSP